MKTAYVIENSIITNAILVDNDINPQQFGAILLENYPDAKIGYTYFNGVLRDQDGNEVTPTQPPEPVDPALVAIQEANAEIQQKLKRVNSIGFLEWEDLGTEKQTAVRAYKQALLDLPNQPDFPNNIQWPQDPLAPVLPAP
jgi:hypothetical protein